MCSFIIAPACVPAGDCAWGAGETTAQRAPQALGLFVRRLPFCFVGGSPARQVRVKNETRALWQRGGEGSVILSELSEYATQSCECFQQAVRNARFWSGWALTLSVFHFLPSSLPPSSPSPPSLPSFLPSFFGLVEP